MTGNKPIQTVFILTTKMYLYLYLDLTIFVLHCITWQSTVCKWEYSAKMERMWVGGGWGGFLFFHFAHAYMNIHFLTYYSLNYMNIIYILYRYDSTSCERTDGVLGISYLYIVHVFIIRNSINDSIDQAIDNHSFSTIL